MAGDPSPSDGAANRPAVRAVVDLTLGAWRPREAATQLARALGVALGPDVAAAPDGADRAAGDPAARLAFEDARAIAAALPPTGTILVLAPRFGRGIGTLNDWFFHFLKRGALQLLLAGEEPTTIMARDAFERRDDAAPPAAKPLAAFTAEQQRLLRFFPGLLPRPVAASVGLAADAGLAPAGTAHLLIPPAYRDIDPAAAPTALDAMEEVEASDDGFRALAQSFCTAHFADSTALAGLAARAFHAGEVELARDLSARARSVARDPAAAAAADLVRQEIRLHQHRHGEILATPEPSRRAPAALRERLAAIRFRADIERGAEAAADVLTARLEAGEASADDLDLLNLHVATRLGSGNAAGVGTLAADIEKAIEATGDDRLLRAARANRAAVARRSGDVAGERHALARLFAATAGSRPLPEIVTMNVQLARLEADPAGPAARGAWLRAAFAWLAFEPFEAFPAEAVEAVLGTAGVPRTRLDQAVSGAIATALVPGGAVVAGIGDELLPAVQFRAGRGAEPERVIGGPGIALLWSPRMDWVPPSPFRQQLLGVAWSAFREAHPDGGAREGTIIVDDNLGTDLPSTRETALAVALRVGVAEVRFGEERIVIDAASRPRLAADLRFGLTAAVAEVAGPADALRVRFRRSFADVLVEGRDAEALAALRDAGRMPIGTLAVLLGLPLGAMEEVMRRLEAKRIVRVEVAPRPDGATAGRSPGSPSSSASA